MAPALSPFFQDHSFDPFLFAAVGEERNGMLLSVLSALARLDLDPWFEAASLSRLPAAAATQRLTSLLSSLPNAQLKVPAVSKSKISWPVVGLIVVAFVMMFAEQFAARRESDTSGVASPAASVLNPGAAKARGE